MKLLSRSEEILLLAIWRLKDNAYGVTIREQVSKATGDEWSFGAIYVPLDTLNKKGYVRKIKGEPVAERGGRSKLFYELTSHGEEALKQIRKVYESIWDGIPKKAFDR